MKSIQNTYNKNFIKRNVSKIPIKTNIFRIDRKDHFVWSSIFDRTSRFDYEATIQRGELQPNCNLSTRSWSTARSFRGRVYAWSISATFLTASALPSISKTLFIVGEIVQLSHSFDFNFAFSLRKFLSFSPRFFPILVKPDRHLFISSLLFVSI